MLSSRSLGSMLPQSHNSFGLVRLGCATAVIVSHAMVLATGDRHADPFLAWTGFKIGDHAVNIFFILSGIVTAASFDRNRSLSTFLIGRALRIVPAVAAFALVFGFLIAPFLSALPPGQFITARETWIFILKTITFAPGNTSLPGVFADTPLATITNESLWTVKYEIICYIALGLGAGVLSRFGRTALMAGVGAVLAAYVLTIPLTIPEGTLTHIRHFSFCYALGLAAYLGANRLEISIVGVLATLAALIWSIGTAFQPMTTIIFTGYVALWLASGAGGALRDWTNRTDLSFGLYVWGWPVGQILLDGQPSLPWPVLAGLNILFALPLAMLSWHLVEHPALALKRSMGRAPRPVACPGANAATTIVPAGPPRHQSQAAHTTVARSFARPLSSGW